MLARSAHVRYREALGDPVGDIPEGLYPGDYLVPVGAALATELTAFCRASLSGVKIPRRIDFVTELPRHDTGKLYKRLIRDAYWKETADV